MWIYIIIILFLILQKYVALITIKIMFGMYFYFLQDVIKTLGDVPSDPNTAVPKKKVKITDCGINEVDKKYDLDEDLRITEF